MPRPSSPMLSRAKIARAALDLVDRTGELTMNALARSLGVRPSSLYNHVAGRADLVEAVRALMFSGRVEDHGSGDPWTERLPRLLRAYRDAFSEHPRAVPLMTSQTVASPEVMDVYAALANLLAESGVRAERLLDVITVLDSFIIGSALDLAAPDLVWDSGSAQDPVLRDAITRGGTGRARADRSFDLGLGVLLDGLRESTTEPR